MFSGIVEATGRIISMERHGGNIDFKLNCPFVSELAIDQSLAHNGVCLTVVAVDISAATPTYTVTAVEETLMRSNLGLLKPGDQVNLERAMKLGDRLDGHIVQGHVDLTAHCIGLRHADGSRFYTFAYDVAPEMARQGYVTVEKGSVTVNGVSLTVCDSLATQFTVAIIPYTFDHTNFHDIIEGSVVNIEFDILGKYLARLAGIASI